MSVTESIITPEYWTAACAHLSKKDRVMKRLIPQFGDACLVSRGDAFVTLARSIVGCPLYQFYASDEQIGVWCAWSGHR